MKILTSEQMREIDRLSGEIAGIPSLILMENAGFHLYTALREKFPDLECLDIAIVCGKGNNGGDGMVLARQLKSRGIHPDVFLLAGRVDVSGDAAVNLDILLKSGLPVFEVASPDLWDEVAVGLDSYDIIVDAILGTGITKPLVGLYARVVADINETDAFVLAVDIPSGMFSDSVEPSALSIRADATVTFTAPKIAQALGHDLDALGDLSVVSIGTPPELLDREDFRLNLLDLGEIVSGIEPRPVDSHKGHYGHVAIVAGSRGKAGAAALGSAAALRAGSGLVTVLTPVDVQALVASFRPEVMTEGLDSTPTGAFAAAAAEEALRLLEGMDAAGIGPGITTHPETVSFVRRVVEASPVPLVIDADGLNAFEGAAELLVNRRGCPLVLTPHPGEFARLAGKPLSELLADPAGESARFAERHSLWLVLKGFRTLVAAPDGQVFVSPRGNPGMATAGMGDVLTGVLTSVLGCCSTRGIPDPDAVTRASCLGVFLHGLAGDLARERWGEEALTAGDVADCLGLAYASLREGTVPP
jgi:ADP-dependent NAD(P)H-hydrate dehydratase / NAD(P)H-hydrate epimerase